MHNPNVAHNRFPQQNEATGKMISYAVGNGVNLVLAVVRCDAEEPFIQIFRLEDGHYMVQGEHYARRPMQSELRGQRARVKFHGVPPELTGTIVRDDGGAGSHLTIIRLDDGRHVLGSECEFQPIWI